jgi:hypothetical protein
MPTLTLKGKIGRVAVAAAILGTGAATLITAPGAGADPAQLDAGVLKGFGSDTIQEITNAFAGSDNNIGYVPLLATANAAGTQKQGLISFDALNAASPTNLCTTAKLGAGAIYRPNGSGEGRAAVSRTIDGGTWGTTKAGVTPGSCNNKSVAGMVDFARSSGGPGGSDTGTDLTYVPFARDGVSFAWATAGGVSTPVTSLTQPQINSIYTAAATGTPTQINGVTVFACGIQSGSGTASFWLGVTGTDSSHETAATSVCNASTTTTVGGGRIEENTMSSLQAKADALTAGGTFAGQTVSAGPVEVIVGFSAGNFISQANGVTKSTFPATTTFGIGSISNNGTGTNLGSPVTGSAPNMAPSSTFFGDTKFGRNVYYVLDSLKVNAAGNTFLALKNMFVSNTAPGVTIGGMAAGHTAEVCSAAAQLTVNKFGFMSLDANTCGNPTLFKGSLQANPS